MKFSFEDDILLDPPEVPKIPLPAGWTNYTLITVLHVIALARIIIMNVANWPDESPAATGKDTNVVGLLSYASVGRLISLSLARL